MISALRPKVQTRPNGDAYIRNTKPTFWVSGRRNWQGSGIFTSDDATGFPCTASGPTLTAQGILYDGVDDYISVPDNVALQNTFAGGGTALAWIKPGSDGESNQARIFDKSVFGWMFRVDSEAAGLLKLGFLQGFSGGVGYGFWNTTNAVVPINTWSFVWVKYNSGATTNAPTFGLNLSPKATTEVTAPVGNATSSSGNALYLGNRLENDCTFDGPLKHWLFYKGRILSDNEIAGIYQATL